MTAQFWLGWVLGLASITLLRCVAAFAEGYFSERRRLRRERGS